MYDMGLTTPPNVSRSVAAASNMGNSDPFCMCHEKRKYTADIAIAVTPLDAMMAANLYVVCSLQGHKELVSLQHH